MGLHFYPERILKQSGQIYYKVGLRKEGKTKTVTIHRLMMEAFVPNPLNLPCINHKDENKQNNFIWVTEDGTVDLEKSNLEWCSVKYNSNYGTARERMEKKMINHPSLSKPVCQFTINGELIMEYSSAAEASRQTGINVSEIKNCCNCRKHADKNGYIHTTKSAGGYVWKHSS